MAFELPDFLFSLIIVQYADFYEIVEPNRQFYSRSIILYFSSKISLY